MTSQVACMVLRFLSPVPIVTALLAWVEWRPLNNDPEIAPFASAIGLFVVSYVGIAISLWPNIVPYRFSLWQATSSESTQAFLLVGTLFLLPYCPDVYRMVLSGVSRKRTRRYRPPLANVILGVTPLFVDERRYSSLTSSQNAFLKTLAACRCRSAASAR